MKKKLFLSLLLLSSLIITSPLWAEVSIVDEIQGSEEDFDCQDAILDPDEDIDTDDQELIEILGANIKEPSLIWAWIQTIGSSALAHCINAQRLMKQLWGRVHIWWVAHHRKQSNEI